MATKRNRGVEADELGNDPIDERRFEDDGAFVDTNPSQPEDTSDTKAEAATASREADRAAAEASQVEANAPDQEQPPVPGQVASESTDLPEGVSQEDVQWWNNPSNRNYMPGDGPQAGITEVDGSAQSASSVDPEVRARTLEEERQRVAAEEAANAEAANAEDESDEG
jgi:hypothetical protein